MGSRRDLLSDFDHFQTVFKEHNTNAMYQIHSVICEVSNFFWKFGGATPIAQFLTDTCYNTLLNHIIEHNILIQFCWCSLSIVWGTISPVSEGWKDLSFLLKILNRRSNFYIEYTNAVYCRQSFSFLYFVPNNATLWAWLETLPSLYSIYLNCCKNKLNFSLLTIILIIIYIHT